MTNTELAVVILAAGQGTRMKSKVPKVLHRIGGRPLIEHVLRTSQGLGAATVRVVVRHERDLVVSAIADYPDVVAVDQDDVPGTGRAVQVALASLPDDFAGDVLVLSADVPLLDDATLGSLLDAHHRRKAAATVLSALLDDPTGYGRIVRDADDHLVRIVEQKDASPDEAAIAEINAGVYVFRAPELRAALARVTTANAQQEMYLTDVVGILRADGSVVSVEAAPDATIALGVNNRAQLAVAAAILRDRITRRWMADGVTILDPATTWIDDTVSLAEDVTVWPNTFLLGATTIGEGATIGPDTTVIDTEVGQDATIKRSEVSTAVVGDRATVGPYSSLRAGTVLAEGAKVGSFSETKNSVIGEGSKVPHLSYVGDSDIGRGVNLGAGTITANYDDVAKHRTTVGDHVHTGSHTVLVAPVTLGDGAKTGAGAVVRKDVPAGALAMSVAPQRNVAGWVEENRNGTAAATAAAQAEHMKKATDGSE